MLGGQELSFVRPACAKLHMDAEPANESPSLRALTRSNILYFTTFIALTVALGQALFAGPMLPWASRSPGLISLLDHARVAGSVAADHFQIQWVPVPYWLFTAASGWSHG